MSALTLFAESSWESLWVYHVMVALEEKGLPYELEVLPMPIPREKKTELYARGTTGKVPVLRHVQEDGTELWIAESLAISEYLAERFRAPDYPRLFPADLGDRAKARQIMSMLRTSIHTIRTERPTSTVFGRRPAGKPLSEKARAEADELITIARAMMKPGAPSLLGEWCIADADLSLALMRLVASSDPLPRELTDYALRQWDRKSVKKFLSHLPTVH